MDTITFLNWRVFGRRYGSHSLSILDAFKAVDFPQFSKDIKVFALIPILLATITSFSPKAEAQDTGISLLTCGIPMVLPRSAPSGFNLKSAEVQGCKARFPHYSVTYENSENCSFIISGATGGWGGPANDLRQWRVDTRLLGSVILGEIDATRHKMPQNYLQMNMHPTKGSPVLQGLNNVGYTVTFACDKSTFSPVLASGILKTLILDDFSKHNIVTQVKAESHDMCILNDSPAACSVNQSGRKHEQSNIVEIYPLDSNGRLSNKKYIAIRDLGGNRGIGGRVSVNGSAGTITKTGAIENELGIVTTISLDTGAQYVFTAAGD